MVGWPVSQRQFVNGACRFGQRCYYLHEYPAVPSVQVCRYFQKGGCWFGENCRYLHIAGPVSGFSGARRSLLPVVNDSALPGHVSATRRGSEPSLIPALDAYSWRRGSEPLVPSLNYQHTTTTTTTLQCPTTDIAEEEEHAVSGAGPRLQQQERGLRPQESDSLVFHALSHNIGDESAANSTFDQEKSDSKTGQQVGLYFSSKTGRKHCLCINADGLYLQESGATASFGQEQSEAYIQSKDIVCGICMDKVYEKSTARERRFGILPNCSHAFCLGCIMTWRKTKDFQEEVIKACPQCRVKSSFYIPSKYWVCEGEPKEALIATFKEKSSKMKCNFFMCHGCCPFASECIFSHELPPGHRPHRRCFRPKNTLELLEDMDSDEQRLLSYLIALTLLDDEDLDFIQFQLV